jgi:hypothetical protein
MACDNLPIRIPECGDVAHYLFEALAGSPRRIDEERTIFRARLRTPVCSFPRNDVCRSVADALDKLNHLLNRD